MNKTAIKNFAISAREKLIADITYKAGLIGVSADGIKQPLPQSTKDMQFFDIGLKEYSPLEGKAAIEQRNALVKAINDKAAGSDYTTAFNAIIEEIAYTWFNRLIAIRFMEVNDYLPGRVRVLSSELDNKNEPDLVTNPFDSDLEFTDAEKEQIFQWKENNTKENEEKLFQLLFIKQCNKLHEILPELFEKTNDYTELLLNITWSDAESVVYKLVHDIPEDDFNISATDENGKVTGQVEIIGWLYQYYISDPKDKLINARSKYKNADIPFVTQLFTSDWIVRYMVQNSLGRLWVEHLEANRDRFHPVGEGQQAVGMQEWDAKIADLKSNWEFYLDEAEQEPEIEEQLWINRSDWVDLNPADIKVIDPCMGSGHILVYCFDVLMQIYEAQGYTQRDAAQSILENNLYGLDIDNRAAQLAYFAVMMKARQYDRRIFSRDIKPHVYAIQESNTVNRNHLAYLGAGLSPIEKNNAINEINGLLNVFTDAKVYGSILNIENYNWELLKQFVDRINQNQQLTLETVGIEHTQEQLKDLIEVGQIMTHKYHVVTTNPPYMNASYMPDQLKKFVADNYADFKSDIFAAFTKKVVSMSKQNGHIGLLMPYVWMFISSYEKMRAFINDNTTITSLVQLEYNAFEAACIPVASLTLCKSNVHATGEYIKLSDFKGIEIQEPKTLEAVRNRKCDYRYTAHQSNFSKIPGSPIAYWVSERIYTLYKSYPALGSIAAPRKGNSTSDNNRFLRLWYEVENNKMNLRQEKIIIEDTLKKRWYPYNKGGGYRKWYGFNEYLVDWYNDAAAIRNIKTAVIANYQYFMKPGLTWSTLTSGNFSIRWFDEGYIFDNGGCCIFELGDNRLYICALLNSKVFKYVFEQLNPTLNYQSGEVAKFPVIFSKSERIDKLATANISISRNEYDAFETSWDFARHPLLKGNSVESAYNNWERECEDRFNQLKANEEELNRIFIDIYGLQDELTPEVEDKDVTVRKADLQRDIKSLLSYAVGCMFGRYSLDVDGLAYAGGEWDDSKYSTFIPDRDNCIPITDEEYFEDDIVGLFCAWLKKVYGEDTLEENLDFIANALGNKGKTSREVIRNYFLNDFIKDHIKIYQKRPIYWLFDSGKQNGFKALVYMHRWNADTVGNLRVEYLHRMQKVYDKEIDRMKEIADTSKDNKEISAANKRKEKLQKQLQETQKYDEKIGHIALSRIDIDLDDGVKVNYEKVQTGKDGKKVDILAKI